MSERKVVVSNFIWRFAERIGAQLVAFVVSVVLARLLDPTAYGTVALITVITGILQVFVDSGLGNALIQKKNADNIDFSTVFFTNIFFCCCLYLLLFFSAPAIAVFYKNIELVPYIRVLGITILISGVKNVQQAYVSRNMLFKKFFFSTLGGTIVAGVVGVTMALMGYGVWALVAQQVINLAIDTTILWITVQWRPELKFSFERLKGLFSFGSKLLASSLLDTVYKDLRQLIIGKMYSSADLAHYNRGRQFPHLIIDNVNTSINSVLLPTMAKAQDSVETVKRMTRRAMKTSTYVMAPLMMGLAFCGKPIVSLVLTDTWLPCVPYMQIFCATYMLFPVQIANLNAIKALGRSDLFLKLEVLKKIVGVILLLSSMWFGVLAMAYSMLIGQFFNTLINTYPNKKLLNYSLSEQLIDILPSIGLAVLMGFIVSTIGWLGLHPVLTLLLSFVVGACFYLGASFVLKLEAFNYLLDIVRSKNK